MEKLNKEKLLNVQGGGVGLAFLIGAGVVFLIGVIDGYMRPLACH